MVERRVSTYTLPVEEYCLESNEVFQFLSCFWHSCSFSDTNKNFNGSLQEMHPVKKENLIRKFEKKPLKTKDG